MKLRELILDRLETSVYQFCKEVGISRTTIDTILNCNYSYKRKDGKEYQPSLFTVKKICRYFKVDYHDYL